MDRRTVRGLEGKNAQLSADLLHAKCSGLFFAEGAQFPGTVFYNFRGDFIRQFGGLRTGALGEGEYVQIGKWQAFDEGEGGGVVFAGFARESRDDVSSNGGVGNMFAD